MALQQLLGKFTIGATSKDFTVAGTALALTTGDYYLVGYTGETSNQLLEEMQAKIRTVVGQGSATVTWSPTTKRVTIAGLTSTPTIVFTDTALATILGFATSLSSANSYTGTAQPRYTWLPDSQAEEYPLYLNASNLLVPSSTSILGRTNNGSVWGVGGFTLYDADITWTALAEAQVLTPTSGTVYADLQQFFLDVVFVPKPIRFYPDASLSASTSFETVVVGREDSESGIGGWADFAARHIANYNGLWDVTLPFMRYV